MNRKLNGTIAILAMILMLFAFTGCSDDDDGGTKPNPTVDEFAAVAAAGDVYVSSYSVTGAPNGMNPSAAQVDAIMNDADTSNDYYIIDYRSASAYANAHIEGAHNMALTSLVDNIDSLPTDQIILNVCYTGQTASTATSVINLIGTQTGHRAVNLKFGMSGWTSDTSLAGTDYSSKLSSDLDDDGFETTPNAMAAAGAYPTISTGETEAVEILKARAREYVTNGWKNIAAADLINIELATNPSDWYVINYFPEANYNAGHIIGAVRYNPNTDLLTTSNLNTLPTNKKIAVYCWTGQTSAQITAYLNMLGYDAYSVAFGVQAMCYDDPNINGTHAYNVPTTDYPLVGTGVTK